MTLSELEAQGAYLNAGYVDIFTGGRHVRLGAASPDGEVALTPEGQAFVDASSVAALIEAMAPIAEPPVLTETVPTAP